MELLYYFGFQLIRCYVKFRSAEFSIRETGRFAGLAGRAGYSNVHCLAKHCRNMGELLFPSRLSPFTKRRQAPSRGGHGRIALSTPPVPVHETKACAASRSAGSEGRSPSVSRQRNAGGSPREGGKPPSATFPSKSAVRTARRGRKADKESDAGVNPRARRGESSAPLRGPTRSDSASAASLV